LQAAVRQVNIATGCQ